MNYYGLAGKMTAQQGKRDDLAAILVKAAELLQSNEGCIQYLVSTLPHDPDSVWISEIWADKAAHDSSLEPQDIQDLIKTAIPVLAEMPQAGVEHTIFGGKGL